jgi:DNA-binding MarR family transcriptional regulator
MRPPQPSPAAGGADISAVDAAIEELRHASYGYFGPASRASFHVAIGWPWSPAHYRVLRMVEASRLVRPTVTDLAGALVTDAARASRIVTELQRSGLVDRHIGVGDRRRREVVLTDAGRRLLEDARRVRIEHLSTVLRTWDAADAADLARLLERFNESVRHVAPYWTSSPHPTSTSDEP